jgi:hypothetical protein
MRTVKTDQSSTSDSFWGPDTLPPNPKITPSHWDRNLDMRPSLRPPGAGGGDRGSSRGMPLAGTAGGAGAVQVDESASASLGGGRPTACRSAGGEPAPVPGGVSDGGWGQALPLWDLLIRLNCTCCPGEHLMRWDGM